MIADTRMRRESERLLLLALFARMDTLAMAIAVAVLGGLAIGLATAVLLLAGAEPGVPVGPHLAGLGTYLPGYSVSWAGVAVGSAYGLVLGFVAGLLLAIFWNFVHLVLLGLVALQGQRF